MAYATTKFDVGKVKFTTTSTSKTWHSLQKTTSNQSSNSQDKVNKLLDTSEQYEIISPVNKEEQPKGNTLINPVITPAKKESIQNCFRRKIPQFPR